MTFETEHLLSEFRKKQSGTFDADGKVYGSLGKCHNIAAEMLELIDRLEAETKRLEVFGNMELIAFSE